MVEDGMRLGAHFKIGYEFDVEEGEDNNNEDGEGW